MSDDRGWYPAYGSDDRGGEGRRRDEAGYDPYAQGQPSGRPPRGDGSQYRSDRGGQQPRDPYRVPQPTQRQPQPQQPWSADPYSQDRDDYSGYGNGAPQQGRGEWTPGSDGRGAERAVPVDAYPRRDQYAANGAGRANGAGGNGAWSPADPGPQGQGQGQGRRGSSQDDDAWEPRSRGARTATASASAGIVDGNVNKDVDLDELDPSGRARRAAAAAAGRGGGKRPASRKRTAVKWTAISVSTILVLILATGAYVIMHLTGNIKHTALLQNGTTQSPEPVDKYGRSPLNILIIGSDSRNNPADCAIGHDCGPGANADVQMVVHLSADRSNATVMSIPRDTMVNIPRCTDTTNHTSGGGFVSTINSSLQWGPSCTVLAVHNLTGLTIDHFVMVDFVGVETLSNALGGVQVCVSSKMYDPNSGLRLNKGVNMVQGASALAFVRTRHGFYDGSDLGREKAQHYFLSQMIKEVRASMNLSDFGTLYKVADAATKALTVDDGLSGVSGLEGLATTMNRVPTNRISFVTMPWNIDSLNTAHVVVAQPYASEMFRNIGNDVPYSGASASSSPSAGASAAPSSQPPATSAGVQVNDAAVRAQVLNGSGVAGRAVTIKDALVNDGFSQATVGGNATASTTTKVYYPASKSDSAAAVQKALGLPSSALTKSSAYSEVTVVLGSDWTSGTTFGGGGGAASATSAAPTKAASAPAVSSLSNAGDSGNTCIPVNPFNVVK